MKPSSSFACKKCGTMIGGHNQFLHDGMCDDCFFESYFPEEKPEQQILKTAQKRLKEIKEDKVKPVEEKEFRNFMKDKV